MIVAGLVAGGVIGSFVKYKYFPDTNLTKQNELYESIEQSEFIDSCSWLFISDIPKKYKHLDKVIDPKYPEHKAKFETWIKEITKYDSETTQKEKENIKNDYNGYDYFSDINSEFEPDPNFDQNFEHKLGVTNKMARIKYDKTVKVVLDYEGVVTDFDFIENIASSLQKLNYYIEVYIPSYANNYVFLIAMAANIIYVNPDIIIKPILPRLHINNTPTITQNWFDYVNPLNLLKNAEEKKIEQINIAFNDLLNSFSINKFELLIMALQNRNPKVQFLISEYTKEIYSPTHKFLYNDLVNWGLNMAFIKNNTYPFIQDFLTFLNN